MRGSFAVAIAACAFGDTQAIPRPVGRHSAFCEPVMATSTRHSSILNGKAPMDDTPSTSSNALWTIIRNNKSLTQHNIKQLVTWINEEHMTGYHAAAKKSGYGYLLMSCVVNGLADARNV